jgi:MauM/NapG family ferredoxin protein
MKSKSWFKIRAAVQLFFWGLFIIFVLRLRYPIENEALSFVPKLSPLTGLTTFFATGSQLGTFIWGFVILALTLVLGRFFCGWICPLGATIDGAGALKRKPGKFTLTESPYRRFKFYVLIVLLVMALLGVNFAGFFDPIAIAIRSYGTALYSLFDYIVKEVLHILSLLPLVGGFFDGAYDVLQNTMLHDLPVYFMGTWLILIFFAVSVGTAFFIRRFWCRFICPLGALYALFGYRPLFKRQVNVAACTNCGSCVKRCRTGAIASNGIDTSFSECVVCFECLDACNFDAVSFSFSVPFFKTDKKGEDSTALQEVKGGLITRRGLVASLVAGPLTAGLFGAGVAHGRAASVIRPPGALPEDDFLKTCIRCGECMKVCPNNAIHPLIGEAGAQSLFTPHVVSQIGYCEVKCNLCTLACPTGALQQLSLEEKETFIMGTAYFIEDLCIPYSEEQNCLVCEELCPVKTKAIRFNEKLVKDSEGRTKKLLLPYVVEELCIGCGICENKCPVQGGAAIKVRIPKRGM